MSKFDIIMSKLGESIQEGTTFFQGKPEKNRFAGNIFCFKTNNMFVKVAH